MWKGVPDRPLALAAVAGVLLLFQAGYSALTGGSDTGRALADAATFLLLEGGEGSQQAAVESARKALELSPASPHRWCDLAEALLEEGDGARAGRCFRRAEELGPAIPEVLLRAFYGAVRQGDEQEKVRLAHAILSLVRTYDGVIYGLYLSSDRTLTQNLRSGFPRAALPSLLQFTASGGDFGPAAEVWQWMSERGMVNGPLAIVFSDALCAANRRAEARELWARFTGTPLEPVWNGGWEIDHAAGKLDWELHAPDRGRVSRDCTRSARGRCSLRIVADWPGNHFFEGVEQHVAVAPGSYRLSANIRTEGVTGEGFGIRAAGEGFDARSVRVTDTAGEWRVISVDFFPRAAGEVRIQVIGAPGPDAGSRVSGTVWVDELRVESRKPYR